MKQLGRIDLVGSDVEFDEVDELDFKDASDDQRFLNLNYFKGCLLI